MSKQQQSISAIRALGDYRQAGANLFLWCALIFVGLILYMLYAIYWLDKDINTILKGITLCTLVGAIASGKKEAQSAKNAHQGATAEEDIFTLVESELVPLGWQFRYNEKLAANWDIDIVALSPTGKTYIIDVKSHKGTKLVTSDGVYRKYGDTIYQFEKDFLKGILAQAVNLKQRDNLCWVTPLLCFTEGWIEYETHERSPRGVVVVSVRQLVASLLRLEG